MSKMSTETASAIVEAVNVKDAISFKEIFEEVMTRKVRALVEAKKQELAKVIFNTPQGE